MQSVAGWSGFVAKINTGVLCGYPLYDPAHVLLGRVYLAEKAHFAAPPTVSNRDGIARLRYIDPYENFAIIHHGSPSCDEDRLGPPEQPSDAQCRASHLMPDADIRSYDCAFCGFTEV
jgi:hypothetical protein